MPRRASNSLRACVLFLALCASVLWGEGAWADDTEYEQVSLTVTKGQEVFVYGASYGYDITHPACSTTPVGHPATATISNGPSNGSIRQAVVYEQESAPCPGHYDNFNNVYYTWTSTDPTQNTDHFHILFTDPDNSDSVPISVDVVVTLDNGTASKDDGRNCDCAGDPITLATGNVYEEATDYKSADGLLRFTRSYNSQGTSPSTMLAQHWRSNYSARVVPQTSSVLYIERPDGQGLFFSLNNGVWTPNSDVDIALTANANGWVLQDHHGVTETYSKDGNGNGHLASILWPGGYSQTMSYNGNGLLSTVQDTYGRSLTFNYRSDNLLQSVATPDGQTISYDYYSSGVVQGVADQLGDIYYNGTKVLSYAYGNSSFPYALTGVIGQDGNYYIAWKYDGAGRAVQNFRYGNNNASVNLTNILYNADGTVSENDPDDITLTHHFTTLQGVPKETQTDRAAGTNIAAASRYFTYDSNGYLASATDWNGNKTTYTNDAHGQPTQIVEASGSSWVRTTNITYDATFIHQPHSVATDTVTTTYSYDGNGNVLTKTLTDNTSNSWPYNTNGQTRTWTYTYDSLGRLSTAKTPAGNVTTYGYDSTGALVSTQNPLGQTTSVTQHLGGGLPQKVNDPNGVTTTLAYDSRDRLTSSSVATSGGARTTSYGYYDEFLQKTTLPDGSFISKSFDSAHRVTGFSDADGSTTAWTLDNLGNVTASTIANGGGTTTKSHSYGYDQIGRKTSDTGGTNPSAQVTRYVYDGMGNLTQTTDPLSHVTSYGYDPLNRLLNMTAADGGSGYYYVHDSHDRLAKECDALSNCSTFVYDGFGDLVAQWLPDQNGATFTYDADGNMTSKTDARGVVSNYAYDKLDRVTSVTYPSDSAQNVTYTYDESGHGFGIGRLTTIHDAAGTLARTYDEQGNVTKEARLQGGVYTTVYYGYDAANRLSSITYPSGDRVGYGRDAAGYVTSVAFTPNGGSVYNLAASVTHEPFGPLTGMTYASGLTSAIGYDLDYRPTSLTASNNVQSLALTWDGANNLKTLNDAINSNRNQSFTYDPVNRLLSASGFYGSLSYTYDKNGNRTNKTENGTSTAYSYSGYNDKTTSIGGNNVGYDANGNITSQTGVATGFAYNAANRMATAYSGSYQTGAYLYDAFGNRVQKTANGSTTAFQYDPSGRMLSEMNGSSRLREYVYLDDRIIAQVESNGSISYVTSDHLGTAQKLTNASQSVTWDRIQKPFGETYAINGGGVSNLRLPGMYGDTESSIFHNGFRDYNQNNGRYYQSDPLGLAAGSNTYLYTMGNPLNGRDLFGLEDLILEPTTDHAYHLDQNYNNSDYFTVGTHGLTDSNGTIDQDYVLGPQGQKLDPTDVGNAILDGNWDKNKPIQLIICFAAYGNENSFAAKLSDYLAQQTNNSVTVLASPNSVNVGYTPINYFFGGYADPGPGGWRTFEGHPK